MKIKEINPKLAECTILGAGDKTYDFLRRDIRDYPPNTYFLFDTTEPIIYIFAKDIENEKPTLLDIEFNDNWKLRYDQLKHYKYLSREDKKPTHMYYFKDFEPRVPVFLEIRSNILEGGCFNVKDYNFDVPLPD